MKDVIAGWFIRHANGALFVFLLRKDSQVLFSGFLYHSHNTFWLRRLRKNIEASQILSLSNKIKRIRLICNSCKCEGKENCFP